MSSERVGGVEQESQMNRFDIVFVKKLRNNLNHVPGLLKVR